MRSMTGFGVGVAENEFCRVRIEMKCVNGKFLDVNTKLPKGYTEVDGIIQDVIRKNVQRGSVDVLVQIDKFGGESNYDVKLDETLADKVVLAGRVISKKYQLPFNLTSIDLLKFDEIMEIVPTCALIDQELENLILRATNEAIDGVLTMSKIEGQNLKENLSDKLAELKIIVSNITNEVPRALNDYRLKLQKRMEEVLIGVEIDQARLLNEVAFFVDKYDITEELTRLNSHILQFFDLINSDQPCGKKLEFLTQELTREVNTLSSKSSSIEITNLCLDAKNIVETLKEQIRNVE